MPGMKNTMHEWKEGKLHSGSKSGPVVKSQAQAVAIGLSEDRKASKTVPAPKPNAPHHSPGVKDSPVRSGGHEHNFERAMAEHDSMRKHGFDASVHPTEKHGFHSLAQQPYYYNSPGDQAPGGHHPAVLPHMPANHAAKHGPAPAPLPSHRTSNYGHAAHQRIGHERTSGHSGAHRLGKR